MILPHLILTALSNLLTNNNIPNTYEEEILIPKLLTLPSIKIDAKPWIITIHYHSKTNQLIIHSTSTKASFYNITTITIDLADPQLLEKITNLIKKAWTTTKTSTKSSPDSPTTPQTPTDPSPDNPKPNKENEEKQKSKTSAYATSPTA